MLAYQPKLVPVILAGGSGSRLWPLSREDYPKQFLPLLHSTHSLFQQTIMRLGQNANGAISTPALIIGQEQHRYIIAEQLRQIGENHATIILEPVARNTAPAIAVAAHYARREYGDDAMLLVMPADHHIQDNSAFHTAIMHAKHVAERGYITCFGAKPTHAETGYGYIQAGSSLGDSTSTHAFSVGAFIEKPPLALAEEYCVDDCYYWNSGMFCMPASLYLRELRHYQPKMTSALTYVVNLWQEGDEFIRLPEQAYSAVPADSIDYAVMEHTQCAAVLPFDCGWSDVGSWQALVALQQRSPQPDDTSTNLHSQNCAIHNHSSQHVAAIGLKNTTIVATSDAILIVDNAHSQAVKEVAHRLSKQQPALTQRSPNATRPWGRFEVIEESSGHKVKRITVDAGQSLSLQMHFHRAEHWIILSGTALVWKDRSHQLLHENESIYIPAGCKHRLSNPGKIPLEMIEVQTGHYLGEDDIIRFADDYGREATPVYAAAEPSPPFISEEKTEL